MKKESGIFNAAEWLVIITTSVIVITMAQGMKSPYKEIVGFLPVAFWVPMAQYRQQKKLSGVSDSPKKETYSKEYEAKYRRLLGMVGGNKQVCDSLISAYGVDRAIEDLIRDRQ